MLCSAQLVRNANAPRSAEARILAIVLFDIDYPMNISVRSYNQKTIQRLKPVRIERFLRHIVEFLQEREHQLGQPVCGHVQVGDVHELAVPAVRSIKHFLAHRDVATKRDVACLAEPVHLLTGSLRLFPRLGVSLVSRLLSSRNVAGGESLRLRFHWSPLFFFLPQNFSRKFCLPAPNFFFTVTGRFNPIISQLFHLTRKSSSASCFSSS